MNTDDISIDTNCCDNLLVLRCIRNETVENMRMMQKEISEMKKDGVILLPKNVSVVAIPENLQQTYRF